MVGPKYLQLKNLYKSRFHHFATFAIIKAIKHKESTEIYLFELTPYKDLYVVICLLNGH